MEHLLEEKNKEFIYKSNVKKVKYFIDEATSSLDADTEHKIQEAVNFLTKNRTTIVIAHRLSTIMSSDIIYVVENGEIAASGKHNNLLENSKIYKNFYEKQLKKNWCYLYIDF